MSHRCLVGVFTMIGVVALTPVFAAAQSTEPPRTPWGAPDLQGVWHERTWTRAERDRDFRSITPLERPAELADKEFLTEEEAANLEQEAVDRNERLLNQPAQRAQPTRSLEARPDGKPGFYNNFWLDEGTTTVETGRTSLDRGSAGWEDSAVDPGSGSEPGGTQGSSARGDVSRTHPRWFCGGPGPWRVAVALHHGARLRTADDAGRVQQQRAALSDV